MDKIEILKAIIYQLVDENKYLKDAVNNSGNTIVSIKIDSSGGCLGSSNSREVILGIKDVIETYIFIEEIKFDLCYSIPFQFNDKYLKYEGCRSIKNIIDVYITSPEVPLVAEQLNSSDFLSVETLSKLDTVVIYALAYSLFHEFGHILYDTKIPKSEQLKREYKADEFAFQTIKAIPHADNANLYGTIMGISYVLNKMAPEIELKDKEHPHSIERLYVLLDSWGISDDSKFWELAYLIICKWNEKYKLMKCEKSFGSFKENVRQAFTYIKELKNKYDVTSTT